MSAQGRWRLLAALLGALAFWCAAQRWQGAGMGAVLAACLCAIAAIGALVLAERAQ